MRYVVKLSDGTLWKSLPTEAEAIAERDHCRRTMDSGAKVVPSEDFAQLEARFDIARLGALPKADPYKRLAAQLLRIPECEVTLEQRREAKSLAFASLYTRSEP